MKKTGCSDRWGGWRKRHRDCNAARAQSGGGAPASSPTRDQVGPFAARAEAKVEIIHLQGHGNIRPRGDVVSVAPSLRICLLGDPELEPGGSRDFRSACFMAEGEEEMTIP